VTAARATPFRIRESVRLLKPGMEIGRESLIALLQRQGIRAPIPWLMPANMPCAGRSSISIRRALAQGLRLDFFGDELETLRLFDPNTQRSHGVVEEHLLLPASEALLDEDSVKRFRTRYREQFGANATSDPLYQAVSDGRRLAGMEHWLPLFEDKLATLFDHLGASDTIVIDSAAQGARTSDWATLPTISRRSETSGKAPGSYRPLDPAALYLTKDELTRSRWPPGPPRRYLRAAGKRHGDRLRLHQQPRFRARARARRQHL
jgi:transcription-repair coupling factor (superfamily II helicase)